MMEHCKLLKEANQDLEMARGMRNPMMLQAAQKSFGSIYVV